MIQMTYQKKNGEIVYKKMLCKNDYKIGDTNGFGWKVIDIRYNYKGNYYPLDEYDMLRNKEYKKEELINKTKNKLRNAMINFYQFAKVLTIIKVLDYVFERVV